MDYKKYFIFLGILLVYFQLVVAEGASNNSDENISSTLNKSLIENKENVIITKDAAVSVVFNYLNDSGMMENNSPFSLDIEGAKSSADEVLFVKSVVEDIPNYYIVSLVKDGETVLIASVDAINGSFKGLTKSKIISKNSIKKCINENLPVILEKETSINNLNLSFVRIEELRLVFTGGLISPFEFNPLWRVNLSSGNITSIILFVDQQGRVYDETSAKNAKKILNCNLTDNYITKEHAMYAATRDINFFIVREDPEFAQYFESAEAKDALLVRSLTENIPDYYIVSFFKNGRYVLIATVDALNGQLMGLSKGKLNSKEDVIKCVNDNIISIIKDMGFSSRLNSSEISIGSPLLVFWKKGDVPDFTPLWQINVSSNESITFFIDQNWTIYDTNMSKPNNLKCNELSGTQKIKVINSDEPYKKDSGNLPIYLLFVLITMLIVFLILKIIYKK